MKEFKIRFSNQTLIVLSFIFVSFLLFVLLKGVIILFLLSFIVAAGIRPIIDKMEGIKVPRFLGVLLVYLTIFVFIGVIITLTIDIFLTQFETLVTSSPQLAEGFFRNLNSRLPSDLRVDSLTVNATVKNLKDAVQNLEFRNLSSVLEFVSTNLGSVGITGFKLLNSVVGIVFSFFIVFVGAGFMLISREKVYTTILNLIPRDTSRAEELMQRIEKGIGAWFVGELFLMTIVGLMSYIFLIIPDLLNVEGYQLGQFAVLLALISGINEAIPNVGPTVTSAIVLALSIAFAQPIALFIYLFIAFIAIQQIEAIFVTPNVMKKVANLNPILTMFGLIAGFELGGVIGAVLSLPIMTTIQITAHFFASDIEVKKVEDMKENQEIAEPTLKDKLSGFVRISKKSK